MDVPAPSSERQTTSIWVIGFAAFWLASAVGGLYITWAYENGPGVAAAAGPQWPGETASSPRPIGRRWSSSPIRSAPAPRASLGELAEALARAKHCQRPTSCS